MMATVSSVACAVVSFVLLLTFRDLLKRLSCAQRADVVRTKKGLFASLPIYRYMKWHVCLALVSISVIFLISVIIPSFSLAISVSRFLETTVALLTLVLVMHSALLVLNESTMPRDGVSNEDIRRVLQKFRDGLWRCTHFLYVSAVVLMVIHMVS